MTETDRRFQRVVFLLFIKRVESVSNNFLNSGFDQIVLLRYLVITSHCSNKGYIVCHELAEGHDCQTVDGVTDVVVWEEKSSQLSS